MARSRTLDFMPVEFPTRQVPWTVRPQIPEVKCCSSLLYLSTTYLQICTKFHHSGPKTSLGPPQSFGVSHFSCRSAIPLAPRNVSSSTRIVFACSTVSTFDLKQNSSCKCHDPGQVVTFSLSHLVDSFLELDAHIGRSQCR
jgi:hypothetical protein